MGVTPDRPRAVSPELLDRVRAARARLGAVILAHNYQLPEVQDLADHTGDSLELSRLAATLDAPVLVFAGVVFMAESAKLLSPDKTVLLPEPEAGCPLADTITPEDVLRARSEHPGAAVVAYINSSAAVKAEADVCCTSANAVQVVNALPQREVVFVPDRNLADWVARHTDKVIHPWSGSCCVHHQMKAADVDAALARHPGARLLVHPECRPEVCARADAVLSTSGMLRQARTDPATEFIIGTEIAMLHRLRSENPGKRFHPLSERMVCRTMKLTTLDSLATSLERRQHVIEVPAPVRERASRALAAMVRVTAPESAAR